MKTESQNTLEKLQTERKSIEDEIEKLRDDRGIIQGQEDAAQTQKTLLQNLAQMPGSVIKSIASDLLHPCLGGMSGDPAHSDPV